MTHAYVTDWKHGITLNPLRGTRGRADVTLEPAPGTRYQQVEGFGGAFTRASAIVWNGLPPSERERVMQLYFDAENGAGYTLCRTPMGGCDFAEYAYTYDDVEDDAALAHFSIQPDLDTTLPMIRHAQAIVGESFRLYACPWSPPAWMKDTGRLEHGGRLRAEHYATMARYFVRFLQAYREQGVPIWGLTAQNEPNECLRWPTCLYSAQQEAEFVGRHLLPALEAAGFADVKVMLWDNNKDLLYQRVCDAMPALEGRVWGAAFHWYAGDHFDQLDAVHQRYPGLRLLSTESCTALDDTRSAGERYAHEMIGDFKHWACGYIDWNLLLYDDGGPSYVDNRCVAPLVASPEDHRVRCTEAYAALCHFSRFARPEAYRIELRQSAERIETVAFQNKDQSVAVIAYNPTDAAVSAAMDERLFVVPAHGMATLVRR